ncbi:MAG: DUF4139 domain-containing protein [Rickettsiales bacterium]|nr:DUF4139 domain-containing protein [Rickettsiales bacterium]
MKNLSKIIISGLFFLSAHKAFAEQDKVSAVTIYGNNPNNWNQPYWYNQGNSEGFAVFNFEKNFSFSEGVNEIIIENLPANVEIASVKLKNLSGKKLVLEQEFSKSSLTSDDLFSANIGKDIEVEQTAGDRTIYHRGKLLQGSPQLFIQDENRIRYLNDFSSVLFPANGSIKAGNAIKWVVASKDEGEEIINYSYKTSGINWQASYDLYYDEAQNNARLEGWAEINNATNIEISEANIKLIAGEVNQISTPKVAMMRGSGSSGMEIAMASDAIQAPNFQQHNFSDYQAYTIDRKVDIAPFSFKKIKLFADKLNIQPEKIYFYKGWEGKKTASVEVKFKNTEENSLGLPLPGGRYSCYIKDNDGKFELAGQDNQEHKSAGQEVSLNIGNVADISVEREQIDSSSDNNRKIGRYVTRITISNAKENEVKLVVKEMINNSNNWKITDSNIAYEKKTSQEVWFNVPIPAKGQNTIEYTVEYYW